MDRPLVVLFVAALALLISCDAIAKETKDLCAIFEILKNRAKAKTCFRRPLTDATTQP